VDHLVSLAAEAASCVACPLHMSRTCSVFASGPSSASIVLLGEAPGANEDATGRPFCGASGRLLDAALTAAGLSRDEVYVCNAVKCRPPANRPPTAAELAACRGFLVRQFATLHPSVVVSLGASALRALGMDFSSLASLRGTPLSLPAPFAPLRCLPTVHPAYVLRRRRTEMGGFIADLAAAAALRS
jgi:DNA polymerase